MIVGGGALAFLNNTAALKGSGVYIASSTTSYIAITNASTRIVFANNVCQRQGGTVYWIADAVNTAVIQGSGLTATIYSPFNFGNGYDMNTLLHALTLPSFAPFFTPRVALTLP